MPSREVASPPALPVVLAERRYVVVPLRPGTKEPAFEHLPGGKVDNLKRRPLSAQQVEDLMCRFPGLGWGVVREGFCTLDLDSEAAWTNPAYPVPHTPTVRTHRGYQLWFQKPPNVDLSNGRLSDDLELLVNGIAILPGHIHPTGHIYTWLSGLSLLDLPPADLPWWVIVLYMRRATRKAVRPRSVRPVPPEDTHAKHPDGQGMSADLLTKLNDDETAKRLLARHGIRYRERKAFKCILPGHKEKRASANIWRTPEGSLIYRDHHTKDGRGSYRLADVFAATVTGSVVVLGRGEQVVWAVRMLAELELLNLPERHVDPPSGLTDGERKVWEGIVLLARCRSVYGRNAEPFPLGWPFMARWCGVSESTVARALQKFLRLRCLRIRKRPQTRLTLFVFGAGGPKAVLAGDTGPEVILFAVTSQGNEDSISYAKRYYLHSLGGAGWATAPGLRGGDGEEARVLLSLDRPDCWRIGGPQTADRQGGRPAPALQR